MYAIAKGRSEELEKALQMPIDPDTWKNQVFLNVIFVFVLFFLNMFSLDTWLWCQKENP